MTINGIRTPFDKRPTGRLVLRESYMQWSSGTTIEFIEYCDKDKKGFPTAVLGRIKNEMLTIPLDCVVERRP